MCYREYMDLELARLTDADPALSYVDAAVAHRAGKSTLEQHAVFWALLQKVKYAEPRKCLHGSDDDVIGLLDIWGARHKSRTQRYY